MPKVIKAILESQLEIAYKQISSIQFGDPNSENIVIVISNPFCNPCSALHFKLNRIINSNCKIIYVLATFSNELLFANRSLIQYYKQYGAQNTWNLLNDWYSSNNKNIDFFSKYDLSYTMECDEEVRRHLNWINENNILQTPTVIINGFQLPQEYDVDDIPVIFYTLNNYT